MKSGRILNLTSGDASIHVEIYGEKTQLICVHGGPGLGLEPFKPTLPLLSQNRSVVLYDQRGCGKSSKLDPELVCPLENHIQDLKAIQSIISQGKPVDLLGHSFGCYLASLFALAWPELVSKLILVSPITPYPETSQEIHNWYSHINADIRKELTLLNYATGDDDEKANKRLQLLLPLYFENQNAAEEFRQREIKVSGLITEHCAKYQQLTDLRPRLENCWTETLILCGRNDKRTPVNYSEVYEKVLPNASLEIIDNCGHFPFMENAEIFIRHVTNFLD